MDAVLQWMQNNLTLTVIGAITLVQITPIKINPWSWIGKKIRAALYADLEKKINSLSQDFIEEKVASKRWRVLEFANSCRQGTNHTHEEWAHCLHELAWYEDYTKRKGIPNGVIDECAKYLRSQYAAHMERNDFL